ncbi:hypothetical protein DPEC_G00024620 [Dallia pectoralis]|uniref:Uncharacterized protein n=1 Tax=Dallia pectoralis TaxID=75939 RepID=A0ACC2HIK8_DALPE|nr:hypothetical protein DPEC_G00024620 [Dallia pectoralis]
MELCYGPTTSTTTARSCSTDPLYDNCFSHAGKGRDRVFRKREGLCNPAVTGVLPPFSPPGRAPAVSMVPTLGGGRGAGMVPRHSPCSWGGLGRPGWDMGTNRGARGVTEEKREVDVSVWTQPSPSPNHSDTDPHQSALSVYDNLQFVTPNQDPTMEPTVTFLEAQRLQRISGPVLTEDGGLSGGSSSWSSCEILLAGCNNSNGPEQYQRPKPELDLQQGQEESMFQRRALNQLQSHLQPPVSPLHPFATHSAGHPQQAGPFTVLGARMPPPLPVADPSASNLRSLLTSLQQQICRQKEMYEERIQSLEDRNEALQGEVFDLRANLAQQRHWYSVVQAKILESERVRAEADHRNASLQREMEQFFDTFGELNNEAMKTEKIGRSF